MIFLKIGFYILKSLPVVQLSFVLVHILHSLHRPSSFLCSLDHQQSEKAFRPWISAKREEFKYHIRNGKIGFEIHDPFYFFSSLNYSKFEERNSPVTVCCFYRRKCHTLELIKLLDSITPQLILWTANLPPTWTSCRRLFLFHWCSLVFPEKDPV